MKPLLVNLARRLTGCLLFRKTLPSDFGRQKIIVTSRSDIRLLVPGWEMPAGDLFRVVRRYVAAGDVVWDIGSNLGILAFSSAVRVGVNGQVFSLEADPRYADIQTRTLKQFTDNAGAVSILCAAVSDRSGVMDLVIPKKGHARNHLAIVGGNQAGEAEMKKQVVTVTLDWLLEHWKAPDFLKMDVEGAELLAVTGGNRLFSEVRPVCYIECSPENAGAMTGFFKKHRYRLFSLDGTGEEKPIDRFEFNTVARPGETCEPGGDSGQSSPTK